MTTVEQGAPRLAFDVDRRLSPNHITPNTYVFGNAQAFAEGGVGRMMAGHGPAADNRAIREAYLSCPSDFPTPAHYAHWFEHIDGIIDQMIETRDPAFSVDLYNIVRKGMLSQTAVEHIVGDVINRKLQMAPMPAMSSYEQWTTPFIVDVWRDTGYRYSELYGIRGPAPQLPTDRSAPERVTADENEATFHMSVYAKEVDIRFYDRAADNVNYVPEMIRQLQMAVMDTEATLACDLVVDDTDGINATFFSEANRNLIGYSGVRGIGIHPGVSDQAIRVAVGEYRDQTSRENMPIAGGAEYLVGTPHAAQMARDAMMGLHNDIRGAAVEINRMRPVDGPMVLEEQYFKTSLDNATTGNPGMAALGLWMIVGDGMARPPAFVRVRHRAYMTPMLLRRNAMWGVGEIEPSPYLLFTMIGFGRYDPRGAAASRNGTARPF